MIINLPAVLFKTSPSLQCETILVSFSHIAFCVMTLSLKIHLNKTTELRNNVVFLFKMQQMNVIP